MSGEGCKGNASEAEGSGTGSAQDDGPRYRRRYERTRTWMEEVATALEHPYPAVWAGEGHDDKEEVGGRRHAGVWGAGSGEAARSVRGALAADMVATHGSRQAGDGGHRLGDSAVKGDQGLGVERACLHPHDSRRWDK